MHVINILWQSDISLILLIVKYNMYVMIIMIYQGFGSGLCQIWVKHEVLWSWASVLQQAIQYHVGLGQSLDSQNTDRIVPTQTIHIPDLLERKKDQNLDGRGRILCLQHENGDLILFIKRIHYSMLSPLISFLSFNCFVVPQ